MNDIRFWKAATVVCFACWMATEIALLYLFGRW